MPVLDRTHSRSVALAAGLSVLAAGAVAQNIDFGPAHSVDAGGMVSFELAVPSSVSGEATLTITYFGDLNTATEFITVYVDGVSVGRLNGGRQCGPDVTDILRVPEATLLSAATDGSVTVLLDAEDDAPGVDGVDDFCRAAPPYSTVFNAGDGVSIAARGTLNFALAAPPPGDSSSDEDMMATRAALIQASGLDAARRVDRLRRRSALTAGTLSFEGIPLAASRGLQVELGRGALGFATGFDMGDAMIWAEGRVLSFTDDLSDEGRFAIMHMGADWLVGPDLMVGVAAQIDVIEQEDVASGEAVAGTGWMIGPVATLRLSEALFFDARLAYGMAENEVERAAGTDVFDSHRALAEISVLGHVTRDRWTIYPELELSYFTERSEDYTSATLGAVDGSELSLGQARLGGTFERAFPLGRGDRVTGYVEMFAAYSHRFSGGVSIGSYVAQTEGWSGEVEIGARYETRSGARLHLGLGTGGLFSDAERVWADLGISIPLQ